MKKESIKVSIIIPVYNRKSELVQCLTSIYNQTRFTNILEIIIIDDSSEFSVRQFLSNKINKQLYKKIVFVRNRKNIGPAASRNVGLKLTKGNNVLFLDSDDILDKYFLENMLLFPRDITMCLMVPKFISINKLPLKVKYIALALFRIYITLYYSIVNKFLPIEYFYIIRLSGMLFPKKYIRDIQFDVKYKSAEDWKFVYEVLLRNKRLTRLIPKFMLQYLIHKKSETLGRNNYFNYYRNLILFCSEKLDSKFGFWLFKLYAKTSK